MSFDTVLETQRLKEKLAQVDKIDVSCVYQSIVEKIISITKFRNRDSFRSQLLVS